MSGELTVIEKGFNQIGVLVPDLDAAIGQYQRLWGIRRWVLYTYDPNIVKEMTYQGRSSPYAMRIALSDNIPNLQVELIQPVQGPSIDHDAVAKRGYGFHHFGVRCEDVEATKKELAAAGFRAVQEGKNFTPSGGGHYAYIDTEAALGYMIELRQPVSDRWPPERVVE